MDYVDQADQVMKELSRDRGNLVKTAQIRRFLTAVNAVKGKWDMYKLSHPDDETGKLPPQVAAEVKYLKVKLAYQIGRFDSNRGNPVKTFAEKARLLAEIDSIRDDAAKLETFTRYVEALVAFHKYYGGKD